jgi:hypothetical protein
MKMQPDGTIFGRAVSEFYNELRRLTEVVASRCESSPTLFETTAHVMCQAAEEAIKKFRAENPRLDRH